MGVLYKTMVLRRSLVLLLLGVIAALVPLAHASPPDQSWIGGLYDDGDYDDAIISITSWAITADTNPPCDLEPTRIVVGFLRPQPHASPAATAPAPHQPRAPPVS